MTTSVTVKTIYHCSLERAFKTPMLCDVSKVHTGFGVMPKVTHCTEDEDWGKPGSKKKVWAAKSLMAKAGEISSDSVIERVENKYWKIEVGDFKAAMLGFTKFVGEWSTIELGPHTIQIIYKYTHHSKYLLLYPLNWLFTKIFFRIYMKRVLKNIRNMIETNEPYQFD
jgi:hypothetical protein